LIVVDASILATALADEASDGDRARHRLHGEDLAAPDLLDLEVASVWRAMVRRGELSPRRASFAIRDLSEMPIARADHLRLIPRCWELRDNLTIYDAAYVALAEALEVPFLTTDRRIRGAPRIRCAIEVLD